MTAGTGALLEVVQVNAILSEFWFTVYYISFQLIKFVFAECQDLKVIMYILRRAQKFEKISQFYLMRLSIFI